jgi:DNA-binding IclR family transcriptional regulator
MTLLQRDILNQLTDRDGATAADVAEALDLPRRDVTVALVHLKRRNLVVKSGVDNAGANERQAALWRLPR